MSLNETLTKEELVEFRDRLRLRKKRPYDSSWSEDCRRKYRSWAKSVRTLERKRPSFTTTIQRRKSPRLAAKATATTDKLSSTTDQPEKRANVQFHPNLPDKNPVFGSGEFHPNLPEECVVEQDKFASQEAQLVDQRDLPTWRWNKRLNWFTKAFECVFM